MRSRRDWESLSGSERGVHGRPVALFRKPPPLGGTAMPSAPPPDHSFVAQPAAIANRMLGPSTSCARRSGRRCSA